jgi:hypothetical protein
LKLVKQNKLDKAHKFDMFIAQILLLAYVISNAYFIWQATR